MFNLLFTISYLYKRDVNTIAN